MSAPRRLAVAVSVPAFLAAGLAAAAPATAAAEDYQGTAFPIKVQVGLAGSTLFDEILPGVVSYPSGGDTSLLELPAELSEVARLKVLNAASGVKDKILTSNARTAQLSVLNDLVTASVLNADCTASDLTLAGDSRVTDLALAGTKMPDRPGTQLQGRDPGGAGAVPVGRDLHRRAGDAPDRRPAGPRAARPPRGRPARPADRLNGVVGEVRKVAEQVKAAVETATGRHAGRSRDRGTRRPYRASARRGRTHDRGRRWPRSAPAQKGGARDAGREEVRAAVETAGRPEGRAEGRPAAPRRAAGRGGRRRREVRRRRAASGRHRGRRRRRTRPPRPLAPSGRRGSEPPPREAVPVRGAAAAGRPIRPSAKKADHAGHRPEPGRRRPTERQARSPTPRPQPSTESWQQRANRLGPTGHAGRDEGPGRGVAAQSGRRRGARPRRGRARRPGRPWPTPRAAAPGRRRSARASRRSQGGPGAREPAGPAIPEADGQPRHRRRRRHRQPGHLQGLPGRAGREQAACEEADRRELRRQAQAAEDRRQRRRDRRRRRRGPGPAASPAPAPSSPSAAGGTPPDLSGALSAGSPGLAAGCGRASGLGPELVDPADAVDPGRRLLGLVGSCCRLVGCNADQPAPLGGPGRRVRSRWGLQGLVGFP